MHLTDGSNIVATINKYPLWRLITEEGIEYFIFEIWLNTEENKDHLFEELKAFVDEFGEQIDWHECTHDEVERTPCVISEKYTKPVEL